MNKRAPRAATVAISATSGILAPFLCLASTAAPLQAQGSLADYERAANFRDTVRGKVFLAGVEPHWLAGDRYLWYRRQLRDERTFVLVDCETGTRSPAFDHTKLAAALAEASGKAVEAGGLPFQTMELASGTSTGPRAVLPFDTVSFDAFGGHFSCTLVDYTCKRTGDAKARPRDARGNRGRRDGNRGNRGRRGRGPDDGRRRSPDRKWQAFVRDHNLYVRADSTEDDIALTTNGTAKNGYEALSWSPDSTTLLASRTVPGNIKEVPLIESSPEGQLTAKFRTRPYARPGDRFPTRKLLLFDPASRQSRAVQLEPDDTRERRPPRPRWSEDGKSFTLEWTDRGHKRFRIFAVDAASGAARTLIDEKSSDCVAGDTFVNRWGRVLQYLDQSGAILMTSERDGWKQLYLHDGKSGKLLHRVTKGEWVVRSVDKVDEETGQIWFQASGVNEGEDPYFAHHYRVDFDGSNFVALTRGDGNHKVQFSPSRRYLIDTWSRLDLPPVTVLRRSTDGSLVRELERADITDLLATGWQRPEPFNNPGRDDKTDIWGVIYRPSNFDPKKKYPIIEDIYAGPHGSFVPKDFSSGGGDQALAELGFVVVKIDGMGTNNRSKRFHDVCWKNVGDAGLPDRILWIKAAARRYPYMDLEKVGIFGTSAGGQSSTGALLFHPGFYKVAVSSCGCHDNRLDKASWNEQWMGYPVGPHYKAQSNIENAHKLQGKLFLIVGELDTNVPPESTMRVVDALIKADKDFDLLVIPGANHTSGGTYGNRRRWDFFVRHLHGVEPRWQ